ncbi:hypothetical protein ZWY2020_054161 [Hordeum vulgare]|nr:hypothetical protein ZWY2020_054161 [Hordeum vulgare]
MAANALQAQLNALQAQLNALLASMFATGMVDDQFQQLQSLEEGAARRASSRRDQPAVDFDKVDAHVHQLKGSSSSVGAQKVKLACMHFRQFYEAKSKDGCLMALALVRSEFCDVRSKFQTMMQLEQQIEACSPKLSDNN